MILSGATSLSRSHERRRGRKHRVPGGLQTDFVWRYPSFRSWNYGVTSVELLTFAVDMNIGDSAAPGRANANSPTAPFGCSVCYGPYSTERDRFLLKSLSSRCI